MEPLTPSAESALGSPALGGPKPRLSSIHSTGIDSSGPIFWVVESRMKTINSTHNSVRTQYGIIGKEHQRPHRLRRGI